GEQFHQHRGTDGNHSLALPSPASSENFPRTREMASSTFLRSTMRLPSSSTLSTLPLVRPSASRTALGRVIWPRSATVASMAPPRTGWYVRIIHTCSAILATAYRVHRGFGPGGAPDST